MFEVFMSRLFRFSIHKEMLTWTKLFFEIEVIFFVDEIVRCNICCLGIRSMLGVLMLTYSVKFWKLLVTKFWLEGDVNFWGAVVSSKTRTRTFVEKLGHGVQFNVPSEHLFLWWARLGFVVWVPQFSLVTFVPIEQRHFNNKNLTK